MPDTGAPYFIPYVEPTDLVRDYPTADEASADAIADALGNLQTEVDGAGGLVAVKSAIFTGVESNLLTPGANLAVNSLTITHACADAANRLVLTANLGRVSESGADLNAFGRVGAAFHDGTGLIGVGTSVGSRRAVGGHMYFTSTSSGQNGGPISLGMVHTPGDTASRTYTVRVINASTINSTIHVNRTPSDSNNGNFARSAATFTLMEVKV